MDRGDGKFERFEIPADVNNEIFNKLFKQQEALLKERFPNHGGTFSEGEEIEIKGSLFRISKIIHNGLKLELLKRNL